MPTNKDENNNEKNHENISFGNTGAQEELTAEDRQHSDMILNLATSKEDNEKEEVHLFSATEKNQAASEMKTTMKDTKIRKKQQDEKTKTSSNPLLPSVRSLVKGVVLVDNNDKSNDKIAAHNRLMQQQQPPQPLTVSSSAPPKEDDNPSTVTSSILLHSDVIMNLVSSSEDATMTNAKDGNDNMKEQPSKETGGKEPDNEVEEEEVNEEGTSLDRTSVTDRRNPLSQPGAIAVTHRDAPNSEYDEEEDDDENIVAQSPAQQEEPVMESAQVPGATTATTSAGDNNTDLVHANRVSDVEMVYFAENVRVDFVKKHRTPLLGALALAVIALVAMGAILGTNNARNNNNNNLENILGSIRPTMTPTGAPTSNQCHFCHGDIETTNALLSSIVNLEEIVVSQIPFRTCQDIYEDTQSLTIGEEQCAVQQAEAGWRCGCNTFPPVPPSSNCTLCPNPSGQTPIPTSASGSLTVCVAASKWLPIVGNGLPPDECDTLRRLTEVCTCVDNNHNEDGNNNATVQEEDDDVPCIKDLTNILFAEGAVEDDSIERTYILCPNTEFVVGETGLDTLNGGTMVVDGQLPITGRSNLKVLCGATGSSANNCTIRDGTIGAVFTNGWVFPGATTRDAIHLEGIRFFNLTHPIITYAVTNLTVVDCIFEETDGLPMASMPWVLGPPPERRGRQLLFEATAATAAAMTQSQTLPKNIRSRSVQTATADEEEEGTLTNTSHYIGQFTVMDCIFRNNRANPEISDTLIETRWTDGSREPPGSTTLVALHVENCLFENNVGFNTLITAIGKGPLTLLHNCYVGNDYSDSPVVVERTGGFGIGPLPMIVQEGNFYENTLANVSSSDMEELCMVRDRPLTCVSNFDRTLKEEACSSYF